MPELFADTSGWANLIDISQPFHSNTAQIYQKARSQKRKIITTISLVSLSHFFLALFIFPDRRRSPLLKD
jgi:hypothetical protein